ncbi:MAG: hypothetical protein HY689_02905 [Chloroflexi bacterium]|nr:hypothetical protein [Chloroflexota bacterium]
MLLLSLDPSPSATGVALWTLRGAMSDKRRLLAWDVLRPPDGLEYASERLTWTRLGIDHWLGERQADPSEVACEWLQGHAVRPAPELDALVKELRHWASIRGARWVTYNPAQWRSGVGGTQKSDTAVYLYHYLAWPGGNRPAFDKIGLNAYDAIGIGLYHLAMRRFGGTQPKVSLGQARRTPARKGAR